ncbi:MAG: response regulator transcription factor [Candidatus Pacebacteria bacterium]|nr:response regulator transcription factor [Candidatus Paceibacterota bacterium]MCF7857569.1 response regulator transcription factor [Candidatus Paceibacterota bacterium]
MRALVIEDEDGIAQLLKAGLESEYFVVDIAEDGEKGSFMARTNEYDIIILDNMLPKKNGALVCEEVRSTGKSTPIIMLSVQSEMHTKVELLNKGADDYLTKPFSFEELMARVRALLRRPVTFSPEILEVGDVVMDTKKHTIHKGKDELRLTKKEFMLLELLLKRKGAAVSRGTIIEHVWDMNVDPFSNTVESHILNIRKKISPKGTEAYIQTIPGIGYKIDA